MVSFSFSCSRPGLVTLSSSYRLAVEWKNMLESSLLLPTSRKDVEERKKNEKKKLASFLPVLYFDQRKPLAPYRKLIIFYQCRLITLVCSDQECYMADDESPRHAPRVQFNNPKVSQSGPCTRLRKADVHMVEVWLYMAHAVAKRVFNM